MPSVGEFANKEIGTAIEILHDFGINFGDGQLSGTQLVLKHPVNESSGGRAFAFDTTNQCFWDRHALPGKKKLDAPGVISVALELGISEDQNDQPGYPELTRECVLLVLAGHRSLSEFCELIGISRASFANWIKNKRDSLRLISQVKLIKYLSDIDK